MNARQTRQIVAILWGTLFAAGCASPPVVVSSRTAKQVQGVTEVTLAPPVVEFIDSNTGDPTAMDDIVSEAVQLALTTGFRSEFVAKRVPFSEVSQLTGIDAKLADDLRDIYHEIKIAFGPLGAAERARLSSLAALTNASHVMFSRCRFYAGPGGSWNVQTGEIKAASSRTVLECHLYDLQARKVVWSNASQARGSVADGITGLIPLAMATLDLE